jgi:hypothetical protein
VKIKAHKLLLGQLTMNRNEFARKISCLQVVVFLDTQTCHYNGNYMKLDIF